MKKFEYKTLSIDAKGFFGGEVDASDFELKLNAMGQQGWELIEATASNQSYGSTRYILCVFKREMA